MEDTKRTTDTTELYAAYPHLARIDELWGTAQCRKMLLELLSDSRDGARKGFDPKHASTIFRLLNEHDEKFDHLNNPDTVTWWQDNRGRVGPR